MTGLEKALVATTAEVRRLRQALSVVFRRRARIARRLHIEQRTTYARLAALMGVSVARAHRIVTDPETPDAKDTSDD